MSFIEHILSYFGYFKTKEKEIPNTISNIIWGIGFNLTEEQRRKYNFRPFYTSIPKLTVESIGGIPNVGEYLTFKYMLGIDGHGYDNFLFVRIKITRVERVVFGEASNPRTFASPLALLFMQRTLAPITSAIFFIAYASSLVYLSEIATAMASFPYFAPMV